MWHVVYTKPRSEKKVYERLVEKGFESYCPVQKIRKQWTDRVKTIDVPLFTSYVFVKANQQQKIEDVRYVPGIVNFVYWLGKPAIIREKDLNAIKSFVEDNGIDAESIVVNKTVQISSGAFKNNVGIVKKLLKTKAILYIEALQMQITVSLKNK
jgi:transcription antitermination factor NusG